MRRVLALVTVAALFALGGGSIFAASALAATPIQISTDPYTNADSQHATQVEPSSPHVARERVLHVLRSQQPLEQDLPLHTH